MRPSHRILRSMGLILLASAVGFVLLIVALLFVFQRRLIYFPQRYQAIELRADPRLVRLPYATAAGAQVAYYMPPTADAPTTATPPTAPARLWVLFGGNASRALDWLEFAQAAPDRQAGYLLIDYPGYGECAGAPTLASIGAAAPAALAALARHLNVPPEQLAADLSVLGHSLGAAAALQFAATVPVRRVVLVSPFTSLLAMARRSVGPFAFILKDRFDNAARLRELAGRTPRPRVTIVHGTADDIVPFAMGEALAAAHPGWIEFVPIKGGDHNWILESAARELHARMRP